MDQADELLPTHGLITLVADRGLPTEASPAAPACLADPADHAQLPKYDRECQASNGADVESIKRDSTPADLADPCLPTPC